jgi:hypothetical protein
MTTLTEQQTLPPYVETKRVVAHIRNTHGRALCGARITGLPASATKACVVCETLERNRRMWQR